jgi:VIT1/CCC1 family predicted Fe2+/Mn2+ transporter
MHEENHFKGSELVRDIVIGMSDGLTVPFALAAGLSGAVTDPSIVVTAGIAEVIAGSIAMGLGGYLAGKTEIEHYDSELKREYYEVDHFPEKEKEEVREVFEEYGLSKASQELIVQELSKNKQKWVDFMMRFELGLEKPNINRARNSALTIGTSYVIGGLIPLAPYLIADKVLDGLVYSSIITLLSLFVFGYFKSKALGQNPWNGALKIAAIGGFAASAAYFAGKFFNQYL